MGNVGKAAGVTGFTAPTGIYHRHPLAKKAISDSHNNCLEKSPLGCVKTPELTVLWREGGMVGLHPRIILHPPLTP